MGIYFGLMAIGIIFGILGFVVSQRLKNRFKEYGKIRLDSGMTGREVAEKMLRDNGITDVKVTSVNGRLTDHYNPANKTVNLSADVYQGNSVAAAAVAAHECGHALQHAKAYAPLQLRSALVPVQNLSGQILNVVMLLSIFGGAALYSTFPIQTVLIVIICCYAAMALFSLVTLPVEFDASRRALVWLDQANITNSQQHSKAANALKWAASTYVVAALGAVMALVFLIVQLVASRD